MTALALAERLDMPRLASDIRTTLVGLERRAARPSRSSRRCARRSTRRPRGRRRQRRAARRCSCSATTTSTGASSPQADAAFERDGRARGPRARPWVPYAAEARWMHARLAEAAGPAGTRRCACSTSSRRGRAPRSTRALLDRHARPDPGRRAASRAGEPGPQPARVLAAGGPGRDHRRRRRARAPRAAPATRPLRSRRTA